MTITMIRSSTTTIGRSRFCLEFMSDFEVRLRLCNPPYSPFDDWGDPGDGYARTHRDAAISITLTRWVIHELETHLKAHRPPFIYYTLGFDFSRTRLYESVGLKLSKIGYALSHMTNTGEFYLYRSTAN